MKPLRKTVTLTYLGNGPSATGTSGGWALQSNHVVRCVKCGDFITVPMEGLLGTKSCGCGALHFDVGRFGSQFGDEAVEVYRVV
jgi:hypothetical protein